MGRITRFLGLGAMLVLLAACGSTYRTFYDSGVDPGVARAWRVADVSVSVPSNLTVSEAPVIVPAADIVWREDPAGDRRAQVGTIVRDAARRGLSGLRGGTPVNVSIQVQRFHALTFEAERRLSDSGVHNITLVATVRDARTGAVLAGPEVIEADTPAFSGNEAIRRRAAGETQKSVISNHLAAVFAGWVGTGPDQRGEFSRLGD